MSNRNTDDLSYRILVCKKDLFEQVIVTNSIPVLVKDNFPQLKVLSVANMLGEAIWRIHEESSVSSMFR